jgi:FKBP-type peptidyl-prolyl cis-trans isomerase
MVGFAELFDGGKAFSGQGRGVSPAVRGVAVVVAALACVVPIPAAMAQPGAPAVEPIARPLAPPTDLALDTPEGTLGYALGLRIGSRIAADFRAQKAPFDFAALAEGLADAVNGVPARLPDERMMAALEAFDAKLLKDQEALRKQMAEKGRANQAKAEQFLAANKARKGVVTLPSGMQYEILRAGNGPRPKPTDLVATHYRGTHLDGGEFDATDPAQGPMKVRIPAVVPAWQEALPLMGVGSKWRLWVPPQMAYGEEGALPVIEPNELLVFEIELLGIEAPR